MNEPTKPMTADEIVYGLIREYAPENTQGEGCEPLIADRAIEAIQRLIQEAELKHSIIDIQTIYGAVEKLKKSGLDEEDMLLVVKPNDYADFMIMSKKDYERAQQSSSKEANE